MMGEAPREAPATMAEPEAQGGIRAATAATAGPVRRPVHQWGGALGATEAKQKPGRCSRRRRRLKHRSHLESVEPTRSRGGCPGWAVPPSAPTAAVQVTLASPVPATPSSRASARLVTRRAQARTVRTVLTELPALRVL